MPTSTSNSNPDDMTKREYNDIAARLHGGEAVNFTAEQWADFMRHQVTEQVAEGARVARQEPQPLTRETVTKILTRYGGNFGIWYLFTRIVRDCQLTPDAFASGLADAYTMGRADRATALRLFRIANPREIMTPDDLNTFENLSYPLTVYRGCDTAEVEAGRFGLSWTTDRAVAEFFAWRFDVADTSRVVVSTTVERGDVLAYFDTRHEREVIIGVEAPAHTVGIAATVPSARFYTYRDTARQQTATPQDPPPTRED